jgi:HEAT repeat protein
MSDAELSELLAQVQYRRELSYFEGLEPLRWRLSNDEAGDVLSFLESQFPGLEAPRNAGIAYLLAGRYRDLGDLAAIGRLYAVDDPGVQRSTLNALWDPGPHGLGPGIVALAVEATSHPDAGVREEACWVLMNQAAYKSDVAAGVEPLLRLLADPAASVRRQSAYAIGHVAKNSKPDLTPHLAGLSRNLTDPDYNVRIAAAWTLWQLSRKRYNLAVSVPQLVALLALKDDVGDQYKNAVGALLHHVRKSPENARAVAAAVAGADLDRENKTIGRLLDELTTLSC